MGGDVPGAIFPFVVAFLAIGEIHARFFFLGGAANGAVMDRWGVRNFREEPAAVEVDLSAQFGMLNKFRPKKQEEVDHRGEGGDLVGERGGDHGPGNDDPVKDGQVFHLDGQDKEDQDFKIGK